MDIPETQYASNKILQQQTLLCYVWIQQSALSHKAYIAQGHEHRLRITKGILSSRQVLRPKNNRHQLDFYLDLQDKLKLTIQKSNYI